MWNSAYAIFIRQLVKNNIVLFWMRILFVCHCCHLSYQSVHAKCNMLTKCTYNSAVSKLLRFYLLKTFIYEFVDYNYSKNKCVFQFHLNSLLLALLMCHCSNLCHIQNNNYNNNYPLFVLICSQPFCRPHLCVIPFTRLFAILLTTFL